MELVRSNPFVKRRMVFGEQRGWLPEELSATTISNLAKLADTNADVYVQDTEVKGLKLRRDTNGRITFVFIGRVKALTPGERGKLINVTIGPAQGSAAVKLAKARAEALRLYEACREGTDPVAERRAKQRAVEAAEQAARAKALQGNLNRQWTLGFSLNHLVSYRAAEGGNPLKSKTISYYREVVRNVGALASKPITEITPNDVRKAIDKLPSPALRSKAKRGVRALIEYALRELELDKRNPVEFLQRGAYQPPVPRTSFLTENQLGDWINKVTTASNLRSERLGHTAGNYALALLLYGMRAHECAVMEWTWIDDRGGTFTIPASASKTKRARTLPVTTWMRQLLDSQRGNSRWVFPGRDPRNHVVDVRSAISEATGVHFRPHDLRRTFATHFAARVSAGARLKSILGHADGDVTDAYIQAQLNQMRSDLSAYQDWLQYKSEEDAWIETLTPDEIAEFESNALAQAERGRVWPVAK